MELKIGRNTCTELNNEVFRRLLSFYPEEKLLDRPKLAKALRTNQITYRDLCAEAETLFIPWQMFFLNPNKLAHHLRNIETNRADRIRGTQISRRRGSAGQTPYYLIDRYIRSQNFVSSMGGYGPNLYNSSLKDLSVSGAVAKICSHFLIDMEEFRSKRTKAQALKYLIERLDAKNINVGIGASETRLVPTSDNHRALYKNISGFCLKDDNIPFIYVNASMAAEEEPVGRQIYTLIYLLVLVGLDEYMLVRNVSPRSVVSIKSGNYTRRVHAIVSELLMPKNAFLPYKDITVTSDLVNSLSETFKTTPSAVLTRLRTLDCITEHECNILTMPPFKKKSGGGNSYIDTAVRKLNGGIVVATVNRLFRGGTITQSHAQYVLFGRIGRSLWREYRSRTGI